MDTRRAIRDNAEPAVLSTAFNNDCTRFICGMDNGIRVFRAKDCVRTIKEIPGNGHGIAIAETLDDRYLAVVGGGRLPNLSPDKVRFVEAWPQHVILHSHCRETDQSIGRTVGHDDNKQGGRT